jgi:hydrogenase nickel incorporation protein HypA/HybF
MHELSLVMSIIEMTTAELQKAKATGIEEIELEIGSLCGVEMASFDFAWQQAIRQTPLEKTKRTVNRIDGRAACTACRNEFATDLLYGACPVCGSHLLHIVKGRELSVKSLVVT